MKNRILFITKSAAVVSALAVLAAPAAWAQATGTSPTPGSTTSGSTTSGDQSSQSHRDRKFVEKAAKDGQMEVAMADLALRKTQNPQVKALAEQLKTDHQNANNQLTQIAQNLGIPIQQSTKAEQRDLSKLEKLSPTEFDREYVQMQLKDHDKDIKTFEHAAKTLHNPQLRQFAQQTVPILEKHLQHTAQVASTVGISQSTISSALRKGREAAGGAGAATESSAGAGSSGTSVNQPSSDTVR